ncbi:MAG TPA: tRNA (adenosine(37)-N6)-threonylcarbamoyltransferase complex ATPase subunit type 1 TsaE [Bacillales bacterium]|nr:tRNA (adenosine(37)-N6)-threonylcarbamoyltransferase complex ATPase subunit type 1 TsaE [Bacillales bacterium]
MKDVRFHSNSYERTMTFARILAGKLQAGDIITLEGDLGAGKTTFTKGLAEGLDIKRNVNSPTFTIIKEYHGRLPLYHMDVYRLESAEEDLGYDEYFEGEGVTVIEWAGQIADRLPSDRLNIEIRRTGENDRLITLVPSGDRYISLCKEMSNENIGD